MDALPAQSEPLPWPGSEEKSRYSVWSFNPLCCCSWLFFFFVPSDCKKTWESNHLFADEKEATLFLGALDSIFLFSYAVVSGKHLSLCEEGMPAAGMSRCDLNVSSQGLYLSGVIGDRVNLRFVLCFGLCGSATVVSIYRCSVYTVW